MKKYTLTNDNAPDLSFSGEEIAFASERRPNGPRSNRWSEIHVYRTAGSKIVLHNIYRSLWAGEHDSYEVGVLSSMDDLIERLGYSDLAKEVYDELKIDASEHVA